jgi:hypothetical protein
MKTNHDKAAPAADTKEVPVLALEKVKTIVIMDVPEGPLLCCQLEDLTLKPERGSSYIYGGRLFDVERAVEVIGVYQRGSHKSTDEQLLTLLNLLCGQDHGMGRIANMRNIGKEEEDNLSGGIIIATTLNFTTGADRLVFLKLRQVQTASGPGAMVQLAREALSHVDSGSKKGQDKPGE